MQSRVAADRAKWVSVWRYRQTNWVAQTRTSSLHSSLQHTRLIVHDMLIDVLFDVVYSLSCAARRLMHVERCESSVLLLSTRLTASIAIKAGPKRTPFSFKFLVQQRFEISQNNASTVLTRNSSGDEIANVNFLYGDIVHYTHYKIHYRLVHKFRHRSTRLGVGTHVYQIQWNNAM